MSTLILGKLDIGPLLKAQAALQEGIQIAKSNLEKTGAIQRFEFTYELAWKTMKRILAVRGIEVFSPKQTFRISAQEGLIKNPETWFEFVEIRNLTVHTYNEEMSEKIFLLLPKFAKELEQFIQTILSL